MSSATAVRTLELDGTPKVRVPKNAAAIWQGTDMDGDVVALMPNNTWVFWQARRWTPCDTPLLPKKLTQCQCIRYGCARCDITTEVREEAQ